MAHRSIDPGLFDQVWFRKLSPEHKLVWIYLTTQRICDNSGVCEIDEGSIEFKIGPDFLFTDAISAINENKNRVEPFTESKMYIPGFVDFQQSKTLRWSTLWHREIIRLLDGHGLLKRYCDNHNEYDLGPEYGPKYPEKPLIISDKKPNKKPKAKRKKTKPTSDDSFDQFWSAYPSKKNKGQALKSWAKLEMTPELLSKIIDSVKRHTQHEKQWSDDGGKYIPNPSTWLNALGWENQIGPVSVGNKPEVSQDELSKAFN